MRRSRRPGHATTVHSDPSPDPSARTAFKYTVDKIIAATEHKTTRKPCVEFKSQVYHLGEYTGRAMDAIAEMRKDDDNSLIKHGMKPGSLEQGVVLFSQMQCMHNVVYNYVRLPGPLLGVSTEPTKLTCQKGTSMTDLDHDEGKAGEKIKDMIEAWTQWEDSSGVDYAIRAKKVAARRLELSVPLPTRPPYTPLTPACPTADECGVQCED